MQSAPTQFAFKLMPSLGDLAFLMPVAFLFGRMDGMQTLLGDCDTGWHIRAGDWILAHRGVPMHDFFSFSKPGQAWFAWEWISEILFSLLNRVGGLAAVAMFSMVLLAVTFALVYSIARRRANAPVALAVTILATAISSMHWLARPHLFTLLFLALFLSALENVRAGNTHWRGIPRLALLPLGTALWTNMHGGFFVGIALVGAYGAGELAGAVLSPVPDAWRTGWPKAARYFGTALACLAASLLNPYTYHLHQHIIGFLRDPYQPEHIMEFLSLSFHHPLAIFFEAMLAGSVLAAVWYARKGSFVEPLLLVMWAHLALIASRNIALFAVVAAPFVAGAVGECLEAASGWNVAAWLHRLIEGFNRVAAETTETDQIPRWHLVSALGLALVAALLWAPHPPKLFRPEFDPKSFPAAAVDRLGQDSSARIFTFDQWGDYLIYRTFPRGRVFIDGRFDYYGAAFEQKTYDVLNVNTGWEKTLTRFGINTVLMPPSSPLTGALKESSHWRVVYDDGVAVVFRSRDAGGAEKVSVTENCDGCSRGRGATKTQASDRSIIKQSKTIGANKT